MLALFGGTEGGWSMCVCEALSWIKKLGMTNIIFTSDCLLAVEAINSMDVDDS